MQFPLLIELCSDRLNRRARVITDVLQRQENRDERLIRETIALSDNLRAVFVAQRIVFPYPFCIGRCGWTNVPRFRGRSRAEQLVLRVPVSVYPAPRSGIQNARVLGIRLQEPHRKLIDGSITGSDLTLDRLNS